MTHTTLLSALLVCALSAITACSKAPSSASGAAAGNPAPAATPAAAALLPGTACERKLLGIDDVAGILSEPVTGTKPLKGDKQTCYFIAATEDRGGPSLMVSLRDNGIATIATFTSGNMNKYAEWKPLAGVGEEAVWLSDLREVNARNGDVLCVVRADGMSKALHDAGAEAQQQKLGALCNTIFARLNLPRAAAVTSTNIRATSGGNALDPACDKDIAPADIADLITAAVTKQPGFGAQSCSYHASAGATVTISLSNGDGGKFTWDTMSNPANTGTLSPLAGIGDTALHARGGTIVIARKGDLVCSVDITGTDNANGMQVITKARGEDLAKKLGALCGKVFAAR